MFIEGIKVLMVCIAYGILPAIVMYLGIYIESAHIYGNGLEVSLIGLVLLVIVFIFAVPFAIANMVLNEQLKAAFDVNLIIDKILEIGILPYLFAIIVSAIIYGVIGWAFLTLMVILSFLDPFPLVIPVLNVLSILIGSLILGYLLLYSNKMYQLLFN